MARYARPGKTVVSVGGFNGIDVTSPGDSLCPAYYMKNFRVTERRELKKRPGYRKLLSGISADSVYAANVAGVDRLIYKSGTVLHATDVLSGADVNLDTHSGASVSYFSFGGKVYVYGFGFNYAFDGEAFKKIEPYIPTVAVTCAPSGGGTVHESLNVLSPYARISYSPDGQSTVYKLPSYAYDVTGVKIDGEETGGYYFDRRTKTLVFDEPPAGGVPDSLEVTFRLSDGMILGMPYIGDRYCVYGGDRDTRVFAYGVGGTLRYSDVTDKGPDPTYFPADNFIEVGDGSEEVTALVRHYDRLIVFTERQTWFLSAKEITYSGETKISYPCSPLNSVVGCAGGAAAYIDNRPVTLSRDGIYVFGQSTVRDERLAKRISDRVTPYIPYSFLCRAKAYDNEYDRELWLYADSRVVIYNYGIEQDLEAESVDPGEPFNVLISGIDVRENVLENSRSDVNIIVTINPKTKKIILTSTPRDFYVPISGVSGQSRDKLTHAGIYGVDASMRTLEDLYGIDITYYVRVNFNTLVQVVNALDGVDVYIEEGFQPFTDSEIYIESGWQTLDGREALAYCRERYSFADGDNQRGRNQETVLQAIIAKICSPSILLNAGDFMSSLEGAFQTDIPNAKIQELINQQLSDSTPWQVFKQAPTSENYQMQPTYSGGPTPLSVVYPDYYIVKQCSARINIIMEGR